MRAILDKGRQRRPRNKVALCDRLQKEPCRYLRGEQVLQRELQVPIARAGSPGMVLEGARLSGVEGVKQEEQEMG